MGGFLIALIFLKPDIFFDRLLIVVTISLQVMSGSTVLRCSINYLLPLLVKIQKYLHNL